MRNYTILFTSFHSGYGTAVKQWVEIVRRFDADTPQQAIIQLAELDSVTYVNEHHQRHGYLVRDNGNGSLYGPFKVTEIPNPRFTVEPLVS